MAYTINLTDGTIFAVVADGTINTDSSQVIVGKNYAGYGEFLGENFVHLLENGANTSAPGAPLQGQLWYDQTNNVIKVYNGTLFKSISGATSASTTPSSNVVGDLWYDTVNSQLKVYGGSAFVTIGPAFTSGEGTSGAIVDTITDSSPGADHVVVLMYVNNNIVGIWSKDATFTPAAPLSGFATVSPGLNMSTTVSGAIFKGTAANADTLDLLNSTQFLRADADTFTTGSLGARNDTGIYFGADSDGLLDVSGTTVSFHNQTQDGDIVLRVNDGGVLTAALTIDGASSNVNVNTRLVVTGNATAASFVGTGATISGNITAGNASVSGTVTSGSFVGTGIGITGNASVSGTVTAGSFSGGTFSGSSFVGTGIGITGNASVSGTVTAGSFSGGGSSITALNASNLASGTVPSARVSGSYTGIIGTGALDAGSITSNFGSINIGTNTVTAGNASVSGTVTAANFAGAGSSITALNASNLASGTVPSARIVGSYTSLTGTGALAAGTITSGFGTIDIGTDAVTAGGILNGNANGVGNIGSSTGYFNTVFAKATSAQYADLAERFASDAIYAPGTVVELGGSEEVTICVDELSSKVFGVVSTQPAYTMNAGSGDNDTHPAIAMTGRVPVMTMGFVTKGDRLVSAGNGAARAATLTEVTAFNVIGRALADKTSEGLGTVEAIVKIS